MRIRCIWLDAMALKACRVLRARLEPLGYGIVCRSSLPDRVIAELALRWGCVVVTSDKRFASIYARYPVIFIPELEKKSARDAATAIMKAVAEWERGIEEQCRVYAEESRPLVCKEWMEKKKKLC